ncbi:zinc transporter ZntB [Fretibacter rubidus]|uniref:zinc transporter ZntB n=1 Tax=Fretibacter rubidus TaxID=570162 RepID=UPI003529F54C
MSALLFSYEVDAKGHASPLSNTDINYHPPKGHYVWLHFDALHADTRTWLTADVDVDNVATRTLLADDSRPRTIVHDDAILMNLRGVNLNPGAAPEDMVGIRFFIQEDRVISVERRPLRATRDMAERLQRHNAPVTTGTFLANFALMLTERMNPTIIEINEQVDALEEQIDDPKNWLDVSKLSELRRESILLRRYMAPQRDALNSLTLQNVDFITDDDRLRVREAADQATRVNEELDAVRERCAIVKDQLTDQRAEQMNRNMMLLSVVAAIFLPLGLISGMMGINVGGMPWVENGNGFWYVTAIVVVIGLIQLLIFRLLKWL